MSPIIEYAISAIIGGGLFKLFDLWYAGKGEKRNEFTALVETYKQDNERLRAREEALEERLDKVEKELQDCRVKLQLMESAHYDLPIPAWLKDTKGVMLSVNRPYEEMFIEPAGKSMHDYIGKDDIEFWGSELGEEYRKNDMMAFRSGKSVVVEETVQIGNVRLKWMILKYVRWAGNTKIGIAGIAFREVENGSNV